MFGRLSTRWLLSLLLAAFSLLAVPTTALSSGFGYFPQDEDEPRRSGTAQPPELSLPDLRVLTPFDLRLILDPETGRAILRFSNSIWNAGRGRLELIGEPDWSTNEISVTQTILTSGITLHEHPVGEFLFHRDHLHWHLEGFGLYEIWGVAPNGKLETRIATSHKVSYCVMDSEPWKASDREAEAVPQKYTACSWSLQGISPGWIDTYQASVAGQWIDITHLSDGAYALVSWVDPENMILEADEANNQAVLYFQYTGRKIVRSGPSLYAVGIYPEFIVPYE